MIPKAKLLLRVKLLPVLLCNLAEHTEIMFPKRYDFFRLSVFGTLFEADESLFSH